MLLIGDVSGHGVEAARVATLVKDVVHAFVHQLAEPSAVMESTNELLIEKGLTGFVTLFLGILDPRTGALRYCSAGHPNTLIRSAGGQVELLEAGSAPLGVFPDYVWGDSEASIKPNDIVFLYTDGTIEARRNGDFFGQTGLITAITHWEGDRAQDLPQAVLGAVLAFAGGALADDVAMVSVQLSADADAEKVDLSA
ncbi:MAG: serine/threonine-protein phosphatase [Actinobacteria bacterium]|nr:serine/threonine-protein phosphatase [Actinomycetota bacterium]